MVIIDIIANIRANIQTSAIKKRANENSLKKCRCVLLAPCQQKYFNSTRQKVKHKKVKHKKLKYKKVKYKKLKHKKTTSIFQNRS